MNTFKKPYNPNIRKTFSTIIAPQIEEDTEKIAQLFILVEQGNIAGVKKLILSNRVKINAKYNDETILHKVLMIDDVIMSESKKLDFIKYLVSNGAFINSYNKFNVTPLHLAVQKKYSSIVKYFIDNKANIDAVTSENLTPLHYATLVNIDSCPLDNMPENIIPTPTAKNTKYNEITKLLITAFKENKKFDMSSNDIVDYADDGTPLILDDTIGTNISLDLTTCISANIIDDISNNMANINNLIKYASALNNTKIVEELNKKILNEKTIIPNQKLSDILENSMKSEIGRLGRTFSIKQNFMDDLKDIIAKYELDGDVLLDEYNKEQKKVINYVCDNIGPSIYELLKYVINLKYQDITTNIQTIIDKLIAELDKEIDIIFPESNNKKRFIDKLKQKLIISNKVDFIDSIMKETIESITSNEILSYSTTLNEIKELIKFLSDETPGRIRDMRINEAIAIPVPAIAKATFESFLNNYKNTIEYIIPLLLGLKANEKIRESIIQWYFRNIYLVIRRIFQLKIFEKLNSSDVVTSIYILFFFGSNYIGQIPNINPQTLPLADTRLFITLYEKINKILEILLKINNESNINKIIYNSIAYSIDSNLNGGYDDIIDINQISVNGKLNLFENKLIPSDKIATFYNGFINSENNFTIGPNINNITNYDVNISIIDSIIFHKQLDYLLPPANWNWDNIKNFYIDKNINETLSNNLFGASAIYGHVLAICGFKPTNLPNDEIKEEMLNFISSLPRINPDTELITYTQHFVINILKQLYKKIRQQNTVVLEDKDTSLIESNINGWIIDRVISTELNLEYFHTFLPIPKPQIEFSNYPLRDPASITGYINNIYNDIKKQLPAINPLKLFVGLLDTQAEFLLNNDLVLDANSFNDFENVFKFYNQEFENLIKSIPLKPGSIFTARAGPAPGAPAPPIAPLAPSSLFQRIAQIYGNYQVPPPGPGVPANVNIHIGNQGHHIKQGDFDSFKKFIIEIKKFRDIIKTNNYPFVNVNVNLNTNECYNQNNYLIENYFENINLSAILNQYADNPIIKNIFITNINIILSYLHFIFEITFPNNANVLANIGAGNIVPAPNLNANGPIHDFIPNPNNYSDSFLNPNPILPNHNFDAYFENPNPIKHSLLRMQVFNDNFTINDSLINNINANQILIENNNNSVITNNNPPNRINFTDIPAGLLNLEQGLLLSLIKQLGFKINTLFNQQISDANSYKEYEKVAEEMKYYLELFLSTLNVFYYYQLFCAIPCTDLYKKLQEKINKFNVVIDKIKPEYNINLPNDIVTLINKTNNIILDQKKIRTRSVVQVLCENTYLFKEVLKKVILSNSTIDEGISMYNSANIIFNSLETYELIKSQNLSISNKYSQVYLDERAFNQQISDTNLNKLIKYRDILKKFRNLTVNLTPSQDNKNYIVTSDLITNFYYELPIEQNLGLKTIKLDDYNYSSFYLGFIDIFNLMQTRPIKIDLSLIIKNQLNYINDNNTVIGKQKIVLSENFNDIIDDIINKIPITVDVQNIIQSLKDTIRNLINTTIEPKILNFIIYKILSAFNINLLFESIAEAFKLIEKLPLPIQNIIRINYEYIYIIVIGIFQSKVVLKKSNDQINNLQIIPNIILNKANNQSIIRGLVTDQPSANINVPLPLNPPYHDIFSIESSLLVLETTKNTQQIQLYYNSNHNLTKFIAEIILDEIKNILKQNGFEMNVIDQRRIYEIIDIAFNLSIYLKKKFIKLITDKAKKILDDNITNSIKLGTNEKLLIKTTICFERLFNGLTNLFKQDNPKPIDLHNALNVLPVLNECIKIEDFYNIKEIKDIAKNNVDLNDYYTVFKKNVQKKLIDYISSNNDNIQLDQVVLDRFNFNPYPDLSIEKCPYNLLELYNDITANDKKIYMSTQIDKELIDFFIGNFLNNVKNNYIFVRQSYYNDAIAKLAKLQLPNSIKHELIRKSIYNMYEKIIVNYMGNLINTSIQKIIKKAMTDIIDNDTLQTVDIDSMINIYLPSEDYSFNFASYTNNLINTAKNVYDISNKLIDSSTNILDIKLVEDGDYDIYNDQHFNSDQITINKLNKYYPIFYSYNYDGREVNKECVIIDYGLIELLLKGGSNINIKDQAGKTAIDYIIEGRMHYILNTDYIQAKLIKRQFYYVIEKSIKNEQAHNDIFSYSPNSIKFLNNYQDVFIYKLKNTDEIKSNIPINITDLGNAPTIGNQNHTKTLKGNFNGILYMVSKVSLKYDIPINISIDFKAIRMN
jgi:hypothetical protein